MLHETPASLLAVALLAAVLTPRCSSDGAITYSDLAKIGYQLLIAVHHCHSHRVMHRDIKPENIMFKHSMDGSPLKLVDFGCGCYMEEETTRALKMGTKLSGTR